MRVEKTMWRWRETGMPLIAGDAPISDPGSAQITGLAPRETTPVFSFYRDFPGILIVLISKTSGMGKRVVFVGF